MRKFFSILLSVLYLLPIIGVSVHAKAIPLQASYEQKNQMVLGVHFSNTSPEMVNYNTICSPVSIPYVENFDSYGVGDTIFPTTWLRLGDGILNISDNSPYSGTGCLLFSTITSTYACAIAPQIDTTLYPMQSLMVSFKLRKNSTDIDNGALQVGVMRDPTDIATFVPLYTITGTEFDSRTWHTFELSLAQGEGLGSYVALRKNYSSYTSTFLDDFKVDIMPSCQRPSDVSIMNVTHNSVSFGWTDNSQSHSWLVAVVPADSLPHQALSSMVTENPCTITNLSANREYDVYVKAICSNGDESEWSLKSTFRTQCLPNSNLPFVENFSTTEGGDFPSCWHRSTNNITPYPYISSIGGDTALYFYASTRFYSLAVSQGLDLSAYGIGDLHLNFDLYRENAAYGRMNVGFMTDPNDLNTFTSIQSIYNADFSGVNEWVNFDIPINRIFNTDVVYLAFWCPMGSNNHLWIDNVEISEAPLCSAPSQLRVERVKGSSALLKWKPATYCNLGYKVEYAEEDATQWIVANASVNSCSYLLAGLSPQTDYKVRVSANCSDEQLLCDTAVFLTTCLIGGDARIGNGTNYRNSIPTDGFYNYALTQQIFRSDEVGESRAITGVKFFIGDITNQTRTINLYLGNTTRATLTASTFIPTSNQSLVYSGQFSLAHSGWVTIFFDTPFYYTGENLVMTLNDITGTSVGPNRTTFRAHTGVNSLYKTNDNANLNIEEPGYMTTTPYRNDVSFISECNDNATCVLPNVVVEHVADHYVTLNWAPGTQESSWTIEFKEEQDNSWTTIGSVSTIPYTIDNLNSGTTYKIRLRSECGIENSAWANVTVTTECDFISQLPYVQDFNEATGDGRGHFIPCWFQGSNNAQNLPYTYDTEDSVRQYALYFEGSSGAYSYVSTPRLDESIHINRLQISFQALKTSTPYFVEVGVMSDPYDYSTFELIGTYSPTDIYSWELGIIHTQNYYGNGHYIAFRTPQWFSNNILIDDVEISEIPTCIRVSNLNVTDISSSTALVSWTPEGEEHSWEIMYAPQGLLHSEYAITEFTTGTPAFEVQFLEANTIYDVAVRALCDDGDVSEWLSTYFRTDCGAISTFPYTENFESFLTGASGTLYCWTKNSTCGSAFPYVHETSSTEGTQSLRFYGTSAYSYSLVAMPQIDNLISIQDLEVTFKLKSEDLNYKMIVGVMEDPMNVSTFMPIDTISVSEVAEWQMFEVSFEAYEGWGTYIAFQNLNDTEGAIYMDEVKVAERSYCSRPSQVEVFSSFSDTITITWVDTLNMSWEIIYGPIGFDPETSEEAVVLRNIRTQTYDITGLEAGVIYDFYVRGVCESGISPWNFYPTHGAPFTYVMSQQYATISSCGFTVTDNGGLNGNYANNSDQILVVYPSSIDSMVVISGSFVGDAQNDYLSIYEGDAYVSGNMLDETLLIRKISSPTNGARIPFTITSESGALTLKFHSNYFSSNEGFAATINCIEAPLCAKPYDVRLVSANSNSVNLVWRSAGANASNYTIAVGSTPNFNPDTCTHLFTTGHSNFTLSNLIPNTTYHIRIQADCGNGVSEWSNLFSFLMPTQPATLPYYSNFSDNSEVAAWMLHNGGQNNKWYIGQPLGADHSYLYVSQDDGVSNIYNVNTPSVVWATRDIQFDNSEEFEFSFKWGAGGEANFDYLKVYIGTPSTPSNSDDIPADVTTLTSIGLCENVEGQTFKAYLSHTEYANTLKRIYFLWRNDYSGGSGVAGSIDSVQVIGLTCARPHSLMVDQITTNSANLSFVASSELHNGWQYVFGPMGFDPDLVTPIEILDTIFVLNGLTSNTAYEVFVRTSCGGGSYSAWSEPLAFFTDCGVIGSLPYSENFDNYGAGISVLPRCWSNLSDYGNYPYISENQSVSSSASLYFYATPHHSNYAVCQVLDSSISVNNTMVKFKYKPGTIASELQVGVMTDPLDSTTFEVLETINMAYPDFSITRFNTITVYLNQYVGSGSYIVLRNVANNEISSGYVDDFSIEINPTCIPVSHLNVSNISASEAVLSWNSNGNESAWVVEYGLSGFDLGTGVSVNTNINSYQFTNLVEGTLYDVYVYADCGEGDLSDVSSKITFGTECAIQNLPYSENFDTYQGTPFDMYGMVPLCWNTMTNNSLFPAPHIAGSGEYCYANSLPNALVFTAGASGNIAMVLLPEFNTSNLMLRFFYQMEDVSAGVLSVGYVIDETNPYNSYTILETITSSSVLSSDSLIISNLPANARLAFRWLNNNAYYSCCIDNIFVDEILEPCDAPTNVVATPAQTTANITWTSNASAWVVEYKEATATNWTASAQLLAPTYSIDGLTAGTDYVVRVKAICENGNESAWSAEIPFTTWAADVITYTITASASGPGTITPNGTVTVQEGDNATFTFAANANAVVAQVLVDAAVITTPADNSYTFSNVVANHTIEVVFEEEQTGINDMNMDAAVALFPNPATSEINIQMADNRFVGSTMQVYDVYGKLITTSEIVSQSVRLDVSAWANGVYIVRINSNEGIVTKRFVKR